MQWTVHGERALYESEWVRLTLVDVEIPGGERFEHHVVRSTAPAAGTIVFDPDLGVLLLWRHRFIPDVWGWEIPAGRVDEGESVSEAAVREAFEETGWQPGPVTKLVSFYATPGLSDQQFNIFLAAGATHVGDPVDASESERVEWVSIERLRAEIAAGRVVDGLSLNGLLYALALDHIG
jgi:8-oxo-dGTP pyrophosphatase MutT (NUDIX family)